MNILYRADGGHPIGTGHVYRAVRLARELSKVSGVEFTLALGDSPAARSIAESAGIESVAVPPSFSAGTVKPTFRFAGVETLVAGQDFDLVCVDMLDTDSDEMGRLAGMGTRVVTLDDRGEGRRFAHAIINVLVREPSKETLPTFTRLFEGPQYVVLDPVFARANGYYTFRPGPIERVFVSLGGGDAAGLSMKVARALRGIPGIKRVEFGIGPAFPHLEALRETTSSAPWESELFVSLPNLLERYLSCDLAVVAGGLTMYEVCCVGAPALAVCQPIDHQLELAALLSSAGALASAGYGVQATETEIANHIRGLSLDEGARKRYCQAGPQLVDGLGAGRVAGILAQIGDA